MDDAMGEPAGRPVAGMVLACIAVLVAGAMLLGPIASDPAGLMLGTYDSEAGDHSWRYAASLKGLWQSGPWMLESPRWLPPAETANIAPLATLLGWPFYAVAGGGLSGLCLAWNAQFMLALLAGALGTWQLVREWLQDDTSGLAAGVAVALVSFSALLHGTPDVGRLETLAQFLYPLHAAFLFRATVQPRGTRDVVAAAATFALLATQGGNPSVFFAVVEILFASWCLLLSPDRRRALVVLGVVAAAGVAGVLPAAWALSHHPPPPMEVTETRAIPTSIAHLLPGGADVEFGHGYYLKAYLGVVAPLVALAGGLLVRRARPWALMAVVLLVPALGVELRWEPASEAIVTLPFGWLEHGGVRAATFIAWNRMATFLPFVLALAVAATVARRRWLALGVALLGAADLVAFGPRHVEEAWAPAAPPALRAYMDEGSVLHLPLDPQARLWPWLPEAEGDARYPFGLPQRVATIRYAREALWGCPTRFRRPFDRSRPPPSPACVAADGEMVYRDGFRFLAIRTRCLEPEDVERIAATLSAGWGEPEHSDEALIVWRIEPRYPLAMECAGGL